MITTSTMSATKGLRLISCGGLITLHPCWIKEFAGDDPVPEADADPDGAGAARVPLDVVGDPSLPDPAARSGRAFRAGAARNSQAAPLTVHGELVEPSEGIG